MLKRKSIAFYIPDGIGGMQSISKNSLTRIKKKLRRGLKPGTVFSGPIHKVEAR